MFAAELVVKLVGLSARFLFVWILLDIQGTGADAAPRRHCSEAIPHAVQKIIRERYPDFHIRTRKDSTHGCPGIVKVDFSGDGRAVYAVVIQKDRDDRLSKSQAKRPLRRLGDLSEQSQLCIQSSAALGFWNG